MPPAILLAGAGAGNNTALWSVGPLALSPSLHCSYVAVCHFHWVTQLGHISPFGTLSWCLCPLPAPWLQHRFLFDWWALTSPSWVGRWCGCTYPTSYTLLFWMWVTRVSHTLLVLFWVIFEGWCSSAVLWLATLCLSVPPVPWWEAFGLEFPGPVAPTVKRLQPNLTTTGSNWTCSCSCCILNMSNCKKLQLCNWF